MPETIQSPSLFAHITQTPGVITAKLVGPSIGQREVPIITDLVSAALKEKGHGLTHLILDFSQVTFMNSMALGMCVDLRNRSAKVKADVIIIGMNTELTNLFRMVKFEKLFTIVGDAAGLAKALTK